jgi:bifunctional DNA primase/polymerase-like protein
MTLDDAIRRGLSVIPCGLNKKPFFKLLPKDEKGNRIWSPYQQRVANLEELQAWAQAKPPAYAIVTGRISGQITVDFDGEQGRQLAEQWGVHLHRKTPSGGGHLDLTHPGFYVPTLNGKAAKELGRRWPGLDIKGDGGYVLAFGRNAKGTYKWLRDGNPDAPDVVPAAVWDFLSHQIKADTPTAVPNHRNGNDRRVGQDRLIRNALALVPGDGRESAGFWLAQQLRDNHYGIAEAEAVMWEYRGCCPGTNTKGKREEYAEQEMLGSLRHAYERPARAPWGSRDKPHQVQLMAAPPAASDFPSDKDVLPTVEPSSAAPELPLICTTSRQLRYKSAEALAALQAINDPPILFARSGMMVVIARDERQRQIIRQVNEAMLCGFLTRSADYYRIVKGKDVQCSPPIDVVRDILFALDPSQWAFPPLVAVVEAPVLRPDGSILATSGYDTATQLYYAPDPDLQVPPIPEQPTQADAKAAVETIWQAIEGFPFVDDASKANAFGTLLTPITKPAIDAPTPASLFDAPQAGVGKSLLADVVSIVATGRAAEMFSAPRDPDEWRKQITMALMSGTPVVVIDNVTHPLDNSDLCKVLTETTHIDRAFRTHDKIALPVKSTCIATGNNIQLAGDMPRRCYRIRMDAKTSRPFTRTGFKIGDLKKWTAEHRGELLAALLTMARAWYVAGKPKPELTPLGSYESWSITVGGILEYAGVAGFLQNAEGLYAEADVESTQWENFLHALHIAFYADPFTVAEITGVLKGKTWDADLRQSVPTDRAAGLRAALPDFIAEAVDRDGLFQRRLGKCFAERVDRRFGASQIHLKRGVLTHGYLQWRIVLPEGSR